jgi:hypothetical protein
VGPAGDYDHEMTASRRIDTDTAEGLLAGRAVADDLEPLVLVVHAYRDASRRPVPPSRELAARMAAGAFGGTTARRRPADEIPNHRGLPAAATWRWRRARMAVLSGLATAAAKLATLSTAAKVGAGVTVALVGIGTAGAAGALPEPAQDRFDTVVESVTGDPTPGPDENAEFGQRVSEDARDGGVDGQQISEEARLRGGRPGPGELPDPAPDEAGRPAELPAPGQAPTARPGQRPDSVPGQRPSPTP